MIYLIRHGKDDESYIGGWSNVGLTEKGIQKINKRAKWIKKNLNIKKIISSDIKRAVETSELIKKELKINYSTSFLLREQNKGLLNGKLRESLNDEEKELIVNQKIDTDFPQGETLIDLYNRIRDNMKYFEELDDNTLLVTHRGVINMFYYLFNGIDLDMDKKKFDVTHGSIHELDMKNKIIRRIK